MKKYYEFVLELSSEEVAKALGVEHADYIAAIDEAEEAAQALTGLVAAAPDAIDYGLTFEGWFELAGTKFEVKGDKTYTLHFGALDVDAHFDDNGSESIRAFAEKLLDFSPSDYIVEKLTRKYDKLPVENGAELNELIEETMK